MISLNKDFPDLEDIQIEGLALSLLESYFGRSLRKEDAPIPVELIAEQHLDYEIEIVEDEQLIKHDILGGIIFEDRIIQISSKTTEHEGRYSFTIAHELGHHVMHREFFLAHKARSESPEMLREKGVKPKAEKQADSFAAALLMPASLLANALDESGFSKQLKKTTSLYEARQMVEEVKKIGLFFNVSNTAVLNRLIDLKYISNVAYQSTAENPRFYLGAKRLSYLSTLIKKFLYKNSK